jgi:uncharacterized protein involved in exopolysaccharide biosynthesis
MDRVNLQASTYGSERLPTLREIAAPLFRQRKLLLPTFLGVVLVTVLIVAFLPQDYQAEMKILVKHERVDAAVSPGRDPAVVNAGDVTEEELNSEVQILSSRDLLERVVVSCNLQNLQPDHFWDRIFNKAAAQGAGNRENDAKKISRAVLALEKKLKIEPLKKTNLIQVTYSSSDPQLAAHILNVLGNLYMEKTVAVHRLPGAFEFFLAESQRYQQALSNAETHLTEFDHDQNVSDPQLERQIAIQKLAEFDSTFRATQVGIEEAEKRAQVVKNQLASTPQQTMSQVRTSDNPYLMQQLRSTLLTLQLKRSELLDKYQPSYRPVQEVQQQIDETLDAISKAEKLPVKEQTTERNPSYEWLQSELTKSSPELASLHARASATLDVMGHYRSQLQSIDLKGATQQDLLREVKEAEGNYLLYVQKREEARIADALDRQRLVNVAIAEAATAPALPAHSHWALTLLLGTLLAGLTSTGFAFAVDYLDPSVRTPHELREVLRCPVLAVLPREEGRTYVS